MRREVGHRVAVVGCVLGPMTLATQLLGIETALYLAADDHEGFERVLDFATDIVIRFGTAQVEAGAHLPIVFEPSGSPAVVPPQFFRELVAPRLTRLFCRPEAGRGALQLAAYRRAGGRYPAVLSRTGSRYCQFRL